MEWICTYTTIVETKIGAEETGRTHPLFREMD